MNPFTNEPKRYMTWSTYVKNTFQTKVYKVSLDAGFDCPNRDGTVAYGGCTFCSVAGSGDFAGNRVESITQQFQTIRTQMEKKWPSGKPMAYFQAYTTTHAPLSFIKKQIEEALAQPDVVGLSIATRPDCLPPEILAYLAELATRTTLWVELGLQTIHNETGIRINRAHSYEDFVQGVEKLRLHNIEVSTHIINGLPGETPEMMIETAKQVGQLDIQAIKIHLLHLLHRTPLVKQYERGDFTLMKKEVYIDTVISQLEWLPRSIIIQRLTGDGPLHSLIGPMWSVSKWAVLNQIDQELQLRNSWQGKALDKGVK